MKHKEITFDRFVRGLLLLAALVIVYLLLKQLSGVLIPFLVAWLFAYMLYPLVCFFQYKCHLRNRLISIIVALLVVLGIFGLACYFTIPPVIDECAKVKDIVINYAKSIDASERITSEIDRFIRHNVDFNHIANMLTFSDVSSFIEERIPQLFSFVLSGVDVILGFFGSLIAILYMFFILMDYENMTVGVLRLVPHRRRRFVSDILHDVQDGMNSYFRGQSLIAFIVGILFAIGFSIIGLPLAIPIGLLIGVFNLVPYLQTIGIVPTILMAMIKSYDTGQNIWQILLLCLLVFAVVQIIQDAFLTPKIMGHVTGLNGAVILLSLSVWGCLLGFVGLIIALPLTTLLVSYYRRFVLEEEEDDGEDEKK